MLAPTRDSRLTSNLVILAIFGHKCLSITSYGVAIWGHEGRGTMGDIMGLMGTIRWPLEHIYTRKEFNIEFGDFVVF